METSLSPYLWRANMGVNFTAIFSSSSISIDNFQSILNNRKIFMNDDIHPGWTWMSIYDDVTKSIEETGCASLHGSRGVKFEIGKNICELSCAIRWIDFLEDQQVQNFLRLECLKVFNVLGSPIYVPQSFDCIDYVMDGFNMQQLKEVLFNKYGREADSLQRLYIRELDFVNKGFGGYYIDNFEDLIK
jgi:hypothetical protein